MVRLMVYSLLLYLRGLILHLELRARSPQLCLGKRVQIVGVRNVHLGAESTIGDGCWINVNHRESDEKRFVVGKSSFIGRNNFFTVGKRIQLGDYFFSSVNCSFLGASHGKDVFRPYILGSIEERDSIIVGTNVFVGADCKVIGNVTIGHGSIIGAGSIVVSDIPPFSLAVGSPARVLKRFDFELRKWTKFKEEEVYTHPDEEEYRKSLEGERLYLVRYAARESAGWL